MSIKIATTSPGSLPSAPALESIWTNISFVDDKDAGLGENIGERTIMNWLNHDHKKFESAVYKCRTACDAEEWSVVEGLFPDLRSSYREHVRIEEEVLFPAYETHPGVSSGPTDSLTADHVQIFNLMNRIADRLNKKSLDSLAEDFSLLYRILIKHHEKEEEIFLPMASQALYSDKDAILESIKNQLETKD